MPTIYEQFKQSFLSGVFELCGKVWWKYAIISLIQGVVSAMVILPVLFLIFDWSAFEGIIEDPDAWAAQIEENPELLFSFLGPDPDYTNLILAASLIIVFSFLVNAWISHMFFHLNHQQINTGDSDLGAAIGNSFRPAFLRLVGISVVIMVVYALLIALCVFTGTSVHPAVAVLLGLIGLVFIVRFVLAAPATVHGDKSVGESIGLSFEILNWRRTVLLVLAMIGAGVALVVATMMISVFAFIIMLIPIIGMIVYYLASFVMNGFIYAFIYGSLSGLYYRYSGDEPLPYEEQDDISDHLIDDSGNYSN